MSSRDSTRPLGLIAGLACRRNILRRPDADEQRRLLVTVIAGLAVLAAMQLLVRHGHAGALGTLRVLLLVGCSGLAILAAAFPARQLALMAIVVGIGAIAVAALLAMFPIKDHAGKIMFVCVALYGACTVIFGFSTIASIVKARPDQAPGFTTP